MVEQIDDSSLILTWKKVISQSLYNYVYITEKNNWKEIEIEAKLGKMLFQGECEEKYGNLKNSFLVSGKFRNTRENFLTFDSSLSKEDFFSLFNVISKEFSNKESKIEGPKKSVDYDGRGYRKTIIHGNVEIIKKLSKSNYDIRNCGKDFRFSISREKKYNNNIQITLSGYVREKSRISFYYDLFVLEFTIVKSIYKNTVKSVKYEVELEYFKIRENAAIFENNYLDFEKIILEFCDKVLNLYEIIKENNKNNNIAEMFSNNINLLEEKFGIC